MDLFSFDTSAYVFAQDLFIRGLGLVYFLAFWSLSKQVLGLYGSEGIVPVYKTLQALSQGRKSKDLVFKIPTLFWWNSSDQALRGMTYVGMILSLFVMLKILPSLFLALLWMSYLSFVSIGLVFMSFQWDALLLEVGFFAIFFAMQTPPPLFLLLAAWVLLFRFMFSSGAVKLLSRCPEWWNLTAMAYHFETQPIPNRLAYYAHQQPQWIAKVNTAMSLILELVVPFLIFGTQEMRHMAFVLLVFLQAAILLTGNYAFFNVLSIVLCVPLLSNEALAWLYGEPPPAAAENVFTWILNAIGVGFILLNALQLSTLFAFSKKIAIFLDWLSPYYIVNSYGLFASMTTRRDEIIIEGSLDGKEWKIYEFKWKPGDLWTAPKQVAPYHPRLDWQMWFAALSSYQHHPWFINFLVRLMKGSKEVLALLKANPFPEAPPKLIRTRFYQYHFSDLETKKRTGQWWTRELKGAYTPILALEGVTDDESDE